jgi:hypothetical protein
LDIEIILGEAGDQGAVLVLYVEEELDDFDVDLEGLGGLILRRVVGRRRGLGRLVLGSGRDGQG